MIHHNNVSLKSKKNLLPFNKCLDVQLLKLVEEHRVLYDPSDPKHMDLDSRETAWKQIGDKMNMPAMEFAAIQCQIHFGDFQEDKHKPGLIENPEEFLPEQYSSSWGAEKKILKLYRKHQGLSHLEAKHLYTKTARELPTYGVTFFVVKEKQKGKMKLVPRLLGINSESILRLDEVTKEILEVWPLTHVKSYHAGKNDTFTLNFGDYSDKEYSVKTNDAYRIRDILEGYIDIIRKRLCGGLSGRHDDSGAVMQDCVQSGRASEMIHVVNTASKVVEQSYVGPTRILPFEQGSQACTGTQVMTVHQMIVTNKGQTAQDVVSGEVPMRSDMSRELVKKLNRMNSNAVKVVTLLTEPTEANIQQVRSIIAAMEEDMPFIQTGVEGAASKQKSEEAKMKLLAQLEELKALVANSSRLVKSNEVEPEAVQDQARQMADLTTSMYFSLDPRRSEFCRRSRQSFIEDDKTAATIRRGSFIHAAAAAVTAVDRAAEILAQDYQGAPLTEQEVKQLEAAAVDKLGKLNAAVALHMLAHSDPKNTDYDAAVNSMNTLQELMPELATDARAISHAKGGDEGKEILDEMKALIEAARARGLLTGCEDHQKIQDAAQNFGDVAGKLVYIFGTGNPRVSADKENEIMELTKAVVDATAVLLVEANQLEEQVACEPGAEPLDGAGVVCADAARDLLHTAQLTAPTIREPHCQSALTASCEALSGAAQRLAAAWKPLVEAPPRPLAAHHLASGTMELAKALDRLKQAYANLGDMDVDEQPELSPEQAERLRFIATINTARGALQGAHQDLDKPINPATLSDREMNELQDRISEKLAQSNAAVASLLRAKSDPQNPDYNTAENAINTISEVTPEVIRGARAVLSSYPDRARRAMLGDFRAWCQGAGDVCASAAQEDPKDLDEATKKFAKASKKLSFAFSPHARKAREQLMRELFSSAHNQAMQMVDDTDKIADALRGAAGTDRLRGLGRDLGDSARALQSTFMVTSPSLDSDQCRSALLSSSAQLSEAVQRLTTEVASLQDTETGCRILAPELQEQQALIAQQADELQRALQAIRLTLEDSAFNTEHVESPKQKGQRLKFMMSASAVQEKAREVEQLLEKPVEHVKPSEEQAKELEKKRARELAAVNAAIALLINACNDRNNPNYSAAEEAIETVSELMPGIISDTKALSASCEDEKARACMLQDIRAWCDAIGAVCASAGHEDLTEFVDSAQHFADTSDKLTFVFNPHKINPKEQQVMQLSQSACNTAKQMVEDSRVTAGMLPTALAADVRLRAVALDDAASALRTTAQLTAPSIEKPHCRAALLASSVNLGDAAGELVSHTVQQTDSRCKDLGAQLAKKKVDLDNALEGIKGSCSFEGSDAVESPTKKEQRLKFITGISAVHDRLDAVDKLLDQPTHGVKLTDQQANDVRDKLSRDVARVNAAVASLLLAKSDVNNPDYCMAEQSIESIAELLPSVAKDTNALSTTCKDEKARVAMIRDMHAWRDAIRAVATSAGSDDLKELDNAVQKLVSASGKMKFIVSSRRNPTKENEVMQLSQSACITAKQMVEDTRVTAGALPAALAADVRVRASVLEDTASALRTIALLTVPSIEKPHSRTALLASSVNLGDAAGELVSHTVQQTDTRCKNLGAQLAKKKVDLDNALKGIKGSCSFEGSDAVESPTKKEQRLKFITGISAVHDRLDAVDKLLDQPTHGVKLTDQQANDVRDKLSRDVARVNAAVASLLLAKSDVNNPDYCMAEQSIESIAELLPAVAKDTNALSTACKDEKARVAMIRDMHAWRDAIRAVATSAGSDDLKELDKAVQKLGSASGKMKFIVSSRRNPTKENEVMQLSQSACITAKQMAEDTRVTAGALPAALAADVRVRASVLEDAASALRTIALLTAPSIEKPHSRTALLASSVNLGDAAGELVSHTVQQTDTRCKNLGAQLAKKKVDLDNALKGIKGSCSFEGSDAVESPTKKEQRLKFITGISAVHDRLDAVDKLLDQPTHGVKLTDQQANDVRDKLSRDVARVNAAVASLLLAKSDVNNPDYCMAEQSIESIAELLPAVAKDTNALSTACKDEKARVAMIRDMHAWRDAIRAVATSAGSDDLKELDNAVQKLGSASGKMKFIVSSRRNPTKENEVMQLSQSACITAKQMAEDTRVTAGALPAALAADVRVRASVLEDAASALRTIALLTAPSIEKPHSRTALLASSVNLGDAAGELVSHTVQQTDSRCKNLGAQLAKKKVDLDNALEGIKGSCSFEGSDAVESPTKKEQRLKFITGISAVHDRLDAVDKLLDQPTHGVKLTDQQAKDVRDELSRDVARVNAAVASLLLAKSDVNNPDYCMAEQSIESIAELLPAVAKETNALSTACKDEKARVAMIRDMHAWCDAIRAVATSAGSDDLKELDKAVQKLGSASGKMKFIVSSRRNPTKENEVMQLSQSACITAKQMAEDTRVTAGALPAAFAADVRVRASVLEDAASALKTIALLTAPSIEKPDSRAALLASSVNLGDAAGELVSHTVQQTDTRCKDLGAQLAKKKVDLDNALEGIKRSCSFEGSDAVECPNKKEQRLKFITGISVVHDKFDAVDNLLDQPTHGVKLTDQQAKDVRDKLSRDVARVNAAVASLLRAKSDACNPDYGTADQSIELIAELVPSVAKETKSLSTACNDEKARVAMIRDMHAWCDAIRAVATSAGSDDLKELDEAVQNLGSASGQMKFIVSYRRNPSKKNEVIQAASEVSKQALQMAAEAERVARTVPGTDSALLETRVQALKQAAQILATTAQLTAPSIHEPVSQAALVLSAEGVEYASGQLILCGLQSDEPALQVLGGELQARVGQLDVALQDLKNVCANKNLSPETLKKEQLKFVTSASAAEKKVKEVEKLFEQPSTEVQLSEQGNKNLQEKLAKAMAQVNAALASIVNAKSDQQQLNCAAAEKSFATISELLPEIVNDTKDLSTSCKDEKARKAMVDDIRAWCNAMRAVCASAASDDAKDFNDYTLQFCNASQKLRFVNSSRKNPVKEQQIMQLSSSACDKAKQMVSETRRVASVVKGDEAEMLVCHADSLNDAAIALHTTAQLTASTIHEAQCQEALLSSADALSSSAQVLVRGTARAHHPAARRLSEEVDRYRDIMDRALNSLTTAVVSERARPPPPLPPKRSSLSRRSTSGDRRAGAGEPQSPRVRIVSHSDARRASQEWIQHMREDASKEASLSRGVFTKQDIAELNKKVDEEKLKKETFDKIVDKAEESIHIAEQELKKVVEHKPRACALDAGQEEAVRRQLELKLARANHAAAALVTSTHPDTICCTSATQATETLTELIPDIVKDAALLSNTRDEKARRVLLDHIRALCEASRRLVKSRNNDQKANEAAVEFGDISAGLLYVVAGEVDPAQEKGVIERARVIGDTSSGLAQGAAEFAASAGAAHALRICDAGRQAADAARALVYTAKLVASTVHHQKCQNSLITASHELSSQLKNFSNTWKPLASEPQYAKAVAEMTAEANSLEKLLDSFRQDLAAGKLVKRREDEKIVIEDTPLRQLASQIMELAQLRADSGNTAPDKKQLFSAYAGSLRAAIRALDVAATRCKRHPTDLNKHQDLEGAVQNLQISLLQSRPSLGDHVQNNVVDLTDFVKDSSKEAEKLLEMVNKTKLGKKNYKEELDKIKAECHKINLNAFRLLNPDERRDGDETSLDGILEVDQYGQDCENSVQNIKTFIDALKEKEAKDVLSYSCIALDESCNYLRFAAKSALATAQSASLDETLDDLNDLEKRLDKMLVPVDSPQSTGKVCDEVGLWKARSRVTREAAGLGRGAAPLLPASLAAYTSELRARTNLHDTHHRNRAKEHISKVVEILKQLTATTSTRAATWQPVSCPQVALLTEQLIKELENSPATNATDDGEKSRVNALSGVDINKLLMPTDVIIEGEPKIIEEKLQQMASKLVMLTDTLALSAVRPESLARTAPATMDAALQLATAARSLPAQNSAQAKRIEEAAQEMCLTTYNLLKAAELVTREPGRGDARNRLRSASSTLTDAINKLVRASCTGSKLSVECGVQARALQAARGRAQPAPAAAPPLQDCLHALQGQRDVLHKLNSDEPLSRQEFGKSLDYITSAVCNSTEYAAQCAYLITLAEHNKELAKEGLIDVPRLQKLTSAMQESCYLIMRSNNVESVKEEEIKISRLNQELQQAVKEASAKTKDGDAKRELTERGFKVDHAAKALNAAVTASSACMDKITSHTLTLVERVGSLNASLERPSLLPVAGDVSADTKAMADDIIHHSKTLINNMQTLVKEVKSTDEDVDPMTWVTYSTQRKSVLDAFDALLNSVRKNGEQSGLVEVVKETEEETDATTKSIIQIQEELARKWLQRRPSSAHVQASGEEAAAAIIHIAEHMSEDMKGPEKDDMVNVIAESRVLVAECSKKYDNDKASLLKEHLRELRRAVERGAVTCVVEDFLQDAPLLDLETFIDAERDECKRKFHLEQKIAELMCQLARTARTARLVARAGQPHHELDKCREQTELLAPRLVLAAQARVSRPDDATAVDNYRALLAEYAAAMTRVRELCDRAVDPLYFVQTAGETMSRMREESSQHNDPQRCAYTSNAITRLANRVISVSMSSPVARADPELRAALAEAQDKLSATVPAPGTRASRLPDWKHTTAEILRTTGEVESALGGENIFKKLPEPDQPIYNAALSLHSAVSGWSARDNEIVGVAKRMAVLMARLSEQMNTDRKLELIATSKNIVTESREVAALAKKLAHECTDVRIKTNLLQVCERIPTISGQLKMLTTVKGSTLGNQGGEEDREAMNMLVTNAQNLMSSVQEVVKAAASASVKIASQRGLKWVRKNY